MRIAIDARPLNHYHKHGIFVYIENLIQALSSIDKENRYFLLYTSLHKKENELPPSVNKNFVKKVMTFPDRDFPFKNFIFSRIVLLYFLNKYKCSIFHSTFYPFVIKKRRFFYVLTVHDLKSLKVEDSWRQDLNLYKKAFKNADILIAVSHATKKDIIDNFSISENKIRVVYEGVNPFYKEIKEKDFLENICKKYKLEKNFFFSLGGTPRKNIKRLIKAFSIFRYRDDFDLVIAGVGLNERCFREYRELAKRFDVEERVKILGYIKKEEDLLGLYNAAFCFIFPSLYEGFGLPVLEAMACKTPVITSCVSSLPEVGGEAVLYIDPYCEENIAEAMEKIVEDKNLRDSLVEKGLAQTKKFSWYKTAEDTLKIYKELCNR